VNFVAALPGKRTDPFATDAGDFRSFDGATLDMFLAGIEASELEQRFREPAHLLGGGGDD
jgi:hypothetical protein